MIVLRGGKVMFSVPKQSCAVIGCSIVLGVCGFRPVYAIDQGYITAIEADVEEFATHEFQPPDKLDWLGDRAGDTAQLMDLSGFAVFLKDQSPGSYLFYEKLPIEYKKQLHKDYRATGDLDRIKQDIFKYTREVKK
jgi:hypothetical protein